MKVMEKERDGSVGFTLIELLTVMAIITLLIGLLVPSFTAVRRFAMDTRQRAELASIGAALMTFRNDYGDYPRSDCGLSGGYCGAQKLTEALLGRDLLGFHPGSRWMLDDEVYNSTPANLEQRKGCYLGLSNINSFKVGDMYNPVSHIDWPPAAVWNQLAVAYVICDVYSDVDVYLPDGQRVRAGAPILYYRANRSSNTLDSSAAPSKRIYDHSDNISLIVVKDLADDGVEEDHPLSWPHPSPTFADYYSYFYEDYITDPRITTTPYPYRPDSYLLISAGLDGKYGTGDDICNFGIR